jgi:hypothetical protein
VERMINNFRLGIEALIPFLERIVTPEILQELQNLTKKSGDNFYFSDELWVKAVYNFALSFHRRIWTIDQLMKSMIPLYMGRTASFVIEHKNSSAAEVEKKIENLCGEYEKLKTLLIEFWENEKML